MGDILKRLQMRAAGKTFLGQSDVYAKAANEIEDLRAHKQAYIEIVKMLQAERASLRGLLGEARDYLEGLELADRIDAVIDGRTYSVGEGGPELFVIGTDQP